MRPSVQGRSVRESLPRLRAEKEVEIDDDCAISVDAPLERKWGDIKL